MTRYEEWKAAKAANEAVRKAEPAASREEKEQAGLAERAAWLAVYREHPCPL